MDTDETSPSDARSALANAADDPDADRASPSGGTEPTVGRTHRSPDTSAEPSVDEAKLLTNLRLAELRRLVGRYAKRHLPPLPARHPSPPEPPRSVGAHARLLPYLQLIPWALALLFGASFLWDFPGVALTIGTAALDLDGLLRIVSVSGLIGFFTNWLAITMLFNPRERRPIFGQGLIPAQRERVVYRLARAVSEELINEQIIKAKIEESGIIGKYRDVTLAATRGVVEDPEFRLELKTLTADYLDSVLSSRAVRDRIVEFMEAKIQALAGTGWAGVALRAYRFWNEDDFQRRLEAAVRELPSSLDAALDQVDHILDRIPEKIEARSDDIEAWVTRAVLGFVEQLDVYGMIVSNMERYDERKLEVLIKNTSNEQLNYIKYLGGILGAVGGLVIWRPFLALVFFAALGGTLWMVDELLYRRRRGRT